MTICGYLVLTEPGAAPAVAGRIAALPGCEVVRAQRHDLLLLVTETAGADADERLRARLESTAGVSALLLTFGQLHPDAAALPPAAEPRAG
jgi:nitrate reductase NapAB chaperone NapD